MEEKDFENLLNSYINDKRVGKIASSLKDGATARLQLQGIKGALDTFVLKASFHHLQRTCLYIADDKEQAAYFQNTLDALTDKKNIHFFPDSFKRPAAFGLTNPTYTLQRTETINRITSSKKPCRGISFHRRFQQK